MPTDAYTTILTSGDKRPPVYSELEGPEEAFELREGASLDLIRVVKPDLVSVSTFRLAD